MIGDVQTAAGIYEERLNSKEFSAEDFKNLLVLYWLSTDPGFSGAHCLSPNFVADAGKRLREMTSLIGDSINSSDLLFWKKYIAWTDLGEDLSVDTCRELLRNADCSRDPIVHIFSVTSGKDLYSDALKLLEDALEEKTFRGEYIASVISAVLKRTRAANKTP